MKIQDVFGSAASGSTGSKTASRNRGGQYLRNRAVPTNPNTARQSNVREGLGILTPQWSNVLTQAQRDAWNLYAANVPVIDTLGATIKLSGINQFVRSNAPRVQAGLAVVLDAPTVFNIGETPAINDFGISVATGLTCAINVATPITVGDMVLFYYGRPTSQGVSYFRGPYRFANAVPPDVDTGVATGDMDAGTEPFPTAIGTKVFVRTQVSRADGRLSADAQGETIIVA